MHINNFSRFGISLFAVSALIVGACSTGGMDEKTPATEGPEAAAGKTEQATTNFVAGKQLYLEKLSETASIELWDQGDDGILLSVKGHKDYDADKQKLLEKAVEAEGAESATRIYKHFNPGRAVVPDKLLDIDRLIQDRIAGRRTGLGKLPSRPMDAAMAADPDTVGQLVQAPEPTALPLEGEAPLTWMAVWFRDSFCSYAGHTNSTCLLDRSPNPYIQSTSTGRNHIITANTDYYDIRFRGYSSDCQFWCTWETRWDERVTAGHWAQHTWLGTSLTTDRRGRIDASDANNKSGPLVQYAMTWRNASGGDSTCKATGQSCNAANPCCIVPGGAAQCLQGVCRNDPTPNSNCDWPGEFCCAGTATSNTYCNRTADPTLRCNSGVCGH